MPVDPQAARLMAMLGAGRRPDWASVTAEERRRGFAGLMRMAGRAPEIGGVESVSVAGADGALPARLYRPAGEPGGPRPGLVYFHGGGLVAGDLDTHDVLCRSLAQGSGCRVIAVGYRRAPEHRFPVAIEDALAAASDVLGRPESFGLDPARIAIGGDSAGATLATVTAGALRHRSCPRLVLQFLLCPVLDVQSATASRREFAEGYLLDAEMMARDLADYAPGLDPADPRLSPIRVHDLAGIPPALIHAAEFDPLRDEAALYADRLAAAGVPVDHHCHPGMIHHFYGLTGFIPAVRTILAGIAADLGARLEKR
ncbi:MAG: alpha/beta hydrolase [Janthinobacterium lividum]